MKLATIVERLQLAEDYLAADRKSEAELALLRLRLEVDTQDLATAAARDRVRVRLDVAEDVACEWANADDSLPPNTLCTALKHLRADLRQLGVL